MYHIAASTTHILTMTASADDEYVQLLAELSQYNMLLEQLQSTLAEGFINLGRANFHNKDSLRGRYGADYYDESFTGLFTAAIDKDNHVSKVAIPEPVQESSDEKSGAAKDDEKTTRQRKDKSVKSKEKPKNKDPIMMFAAGFSVPSSLRESQRNFKSSTAVMFDLINCRSDILKRIEQLKAE
ncbi:Vma22 protein [Maudiozyma humilis]|uniref:Vacuolar ATPase assembly protein VMA22 n=1 Tax=Maudiozyma humilis TaxID=51915 RepID=A0AAV5RTL0_MAUHU|nr:Vma22 protein [Kazachstania humilis]